MLERARTPSMSGEWRIRKTLKRSTFEMAMEVLEIMEKKNVPTNIMFAANIGWPRFMTIIAKLKTAGLVK
ncbi:hypothetical protein MUP77_05815, partial [Candidatus Bathyarchaeota archaeon]|nr:hypothetical protein [Candidatus Bathyarchaeota archaeon]